MNTSETIQLGGDATQLIAAYKAANAAAEDLRRKSKEHSDETRKQSQEEMRLIRDAKKATEERIPAVDRLAVTTLRYNDLVKKGRLTQDEANAALERQRKLLDETGDAAEGLAGKASAGAMEMAAAVTGIGSALAAAMAVVSAIKAEYDELRRMEADRAKAAVGFGDAMRSTLINFSPDATVGRDTLESRIKAIAQETGAGESAVAQAASSAFSSKANLDNATALEAVRQAMRVAPHDPAAADELGSRALHLMAASGQTDPRAVMGMLVQAQGKSTITNLKQLGANLLPAAVSGMATGDSAEQAAELFVTLNSLMKDKEGSVSKTAAINLGAKLAESMPELENSESRMAALRADPQRLRAFLKANSFDAQSEAPIRQLLSGEAGALATERDVRAGIGGFATGAKSFEEFVAGINASGSQFVPTMDRQNVANVAAFKLAREQDAKAGTANTTFDETLNQIDFPGLNFPQRWLASSDVFALEMNGMPRSQAQATVLGGVLAGSLGSNPDAATVKLLTDQIAVLRQISAHTSRTPVGQAPEHALGRK